ncbi:GcrA family cell cycle regulator [Magnetospira sp. QH-2]|uniref:GcrA family cell cycle regulator n=1 Tax=Magnetospira sp. (strain QH-2) TaxID=1288970 RepID=UPI0003E81687|nr:GcrA family cell cycle regulator [Magnetospira sp. QH-2]CCQ72443.1 putative GcrA cell cycle regulator [Magnetospira sp. QH-2]
MSQDWTPDRIKLLTELWSEGLATGEIGRRLGFTKNAVIGKAHRLGLPKRQSPIQRAAAAKKTTPRETAPAKKASKAPAAKAEPAVAAPKPEPKPEPKPAPVAKAKKSGKNEIITLDQLTHGMCCWPIGEPGKPDFQFCGETAVPGKPYCLPHCQIAYVKSSKGDRADRAKKQAAAAAAAAAATKADAAA